jgi:ADP-ribosylglycohydrolase
MTKIVLNTAEYRDKVLACWIGKNIGGTLGAPMEWRRQVNHVTFYTQELGGEPLPNDDLDIQLLWLVALEERGIVLDAHTLAEYWCLYVTPHWAEYGIGKVNLRAGLPPPLSGTLNNAYKDSCGAFIRSEIWACIAPGDPARAARYAYQDAILDHGRGEGTYAAVFCAALESAAFLVSDLRALIEIGLSYIPPDCGVALAVGTAIAAYDAGESWLEARQDILRGHRGSSFLGDTRFTSPEDRALGFHEGQLGYDAPSNIAIIVLGLLYGELDFDQMLCTTVNCGEDTDCTGATAGSIFGIIHGTRGIPQKWIDPIGRAIKTATLNLGELGYFGGQLPQTVDELTDRTTRLARQVFLRYPRGPLVLVDDRPTDLSAVDLQALKAADGGASLYASQGGPLFTFDFFTVALDYGNTPTIRSGEQKTIRLTIRNTYKVQANLAFHWYLPEGWSITPAADGVAMSLPGDHPATLSFTLQAGQVAQPMQRGVLEITSPGRPTVMLVPLTLYNGNVMPE